MDFTQRLEEAIREWPGGGKRAFARAMQAKDIRGASYRTLVNYLGGVTEPSPTWITAAAEELGVTRQWLIEGGGPMRTTDTDTDPGQDGFDAWRLFQECAGPHLAEKAHHIIVSAWWNAVNLILSSAPEREATLEDVKEVGSWLVRVALVIANSIRPEGATASRRDFNLFYSLLFNAIATAAPYPGEGFPLQELVRRVKGESNGTP